mmetsp:Transcript_56150/g.150270  ORF Transcript_56150/g.150270 Transcript_56150/m.150270 type:complete len:235 (+) Transcript_56150:304-1008(+)
MLREHLPGWQEHRLVVLGHETLHAPHELRGAVLGPRALLEVVREALPVPLVVGIRPVPREEQVAKAAVLLVDVVGVLLELEPSVVDLPDPLRDVQGGRPEVRLEVLEAVQEARHEDVPGDDQPEELLGGPLVLREAVQAALVQVLQDAVAEEGHDALLPLRRLGRQREVHHLPDETPDLLVGLGAELVHLGRGGAGHAVQVELQAQRLARCLRDVGLHVVAQDLVDDVGVERGE